MNLRTKLSVVALLSSASISMAAVTGVTNITYSDAPFLRTLLTATAGGVTYSQSQMAYGTTTNIAGLQFNVDDSFTLSTIVPNIGNTGGTGLSLPTKTLFFGGNDYVSAGLALDFFIFEAGATSADSISVAPVFTDDTLGQNTSIASANWGNSGPTIGGPVQGSQFIWGVGFSLTDLKNALGVNLLPTDVIRGIAITAGGGVDIAGIYAMPVPEPSTMALALLGMGGLVLFRKRS